MRLGIRIKLAIREVIKFLAFLVAVVIVLFMAPFMAFQALMDEVRKKP